MTGYARWRALWVPSAIVDELADNHPERRLQYRRGIDRRGKH